MFSTHRYVEIYNELVEDLFDPARVELSVAEDALLGPIVSEATLRDVHGPQQLLQLITEGREKRQRGTNAFGPTHPRTSAALILLLNQYTESSSVRLCTSILLAGIARFSVLIRRLCALFLLCLVYRTDDVETDDCGHAGSREAGGRRRGAACSRGPDLAPELVWVGKCDPRSVEP